MNFPKNTMLWPSLIGVFLLTFVQAEEFWSYLESANGTSKWPEKYKQCSGFSQSPIRLPGEKVIEKKSLMPVYIFQGGPIAPSSIKFALSLEQHYLKLTIPPETYFLSLMNNNQKQYEITEINFHWGSENGRGSEHWLYGRPYAMETQVMAYNKLLYRTKEKAMHGPNGFAGLSFIHEACTDVTKDETLIGMMPGLEEILTDYHNDTSHREMDGFDLANMLRTLDRGNYFRYEGSLTTPPCTENVVWTVFKETVPILTKQLEVFRKLRDTVNDVEYRMANNYRPTQPLNRENSHIPRKVFSTINAAPKAQLTFSTLATLIIGLIVKSVHW